MQALLLNTLSKLTSSDSTRFNDLIVDIYSEVNKEGSSVSIPQFSLDDASKTKKKLEIRRSYRWPTSYRISKIVNHAPFQFEHFLEPLKAAAEQSSLVLDDKKLQKVE